MKLTIKNLEKRYGIQVSSVMNFDLGKRVWQFDYKGQTLQFETKALIKEFFDEMQERSA